MTQNKTSKLVTTAVFIALASVLSLIRVFKMPMGGSVTLLSMLPIAVIALKYGCRWGFLSAFVYSLVQLLMDLPETMSWGLTPAVLAGTFFLDYIGAFTALGFCGIFGKNSTKSIVSGIALAMVIRFLFHLLSGCILFSTWAWEGWNPYVYSFCYNGLFMLPEMIFTIAGALLLFKLPSFKKYL